MSKIRAIIIDDELSARNVLSSLLELSFSHIEIIATADNLSDGVELIKSEKPNLVFLDVEMPEYAGYEIVRFFDKINFHIIFVTAYNEYAIKAFDVNAVDYLLKPVDRLRLKNAIEKVEKKIEENTVVANYQDLVDRLANNETKTIALNEAGNRYLINLDNIIAICAQGSYSEVYMIENKKMLISKNIGVFETDLNDSDSFFRIHKSWLINKTYISSYSRGKSKVILENNIVANISRRKKEEFERVFQSITTGV